MAKIPAGGGPPCPPVSYAYAGMVTPISNMDLLSTEPLTNVNGNCNEVRIFEEDGKTLAAALGDGLLGSFLPWSFKTP